MRERAQRIGGKFTVWSAPDAGTEIAVSIPAGRAYAERERRSWLARKILRDREDAESA
jgi:signal transduction histidine kinase